MKIVETSSLETGQSVSVICYPEREQFALNPFVIAQVGSYGNKWDYSIVVAEYLRAPTPTECDVVSE